MMRHITFVVSKETNEVYAGANKANGSYPQFLEKYDNDKNILVDVSTDDERFTNLINLKYENGAVVVDADAVAQKELKALIQQLKQKREDDLNANTVSMLGYEFNARPKDLSNIQLGIEKNETLWPDINDHMVDIVNTDLQFLLATGIQQGEEIWDTYKQAVKALQ